MPTITFKSWELVDKEYELVEVIMKVTGKTQEGALAIVNSLSQCRPVSMEVSKEHVPEFKEKVERIGGQISN
jgi:hypothetical protein